MSFSVNSLLFSLLLVGNLARKGLSQEAIAATYCSLNCQHNTSCIRGPADFSWHPLQPNGEPFDFHQAMDSAGWHCACPFGLTGLDCGRSYEACGGTLEEPHHVCYNGGQCIDGLQDLYGNDQLYCNCVSKHDENGNEVRYTGKYCEIEIDSSVTRCNDNESYNDNGSFCTNGGTCKEPVDHVNPCNCPDGFLGRHCEFVTGTVPECTLDCQNGGQCRLGTMTYHDGRNGDHNADENSMNFQHCDCPDYAKGDLCEKNTRQCGDTFCLHGSECVSVEQEDGSMDFHCDCTPASTQTKKFAGRHCQHKSTVLCPYQATFCTRDGTCPALALEDCNCPEGYLGAHCEFTTGELERYERNHQKNNNDNGNNDNGDSESSNSGNSDTTNNSNNNVSTNNDNLYNPKCVLECHNGGKCRKGAKKLDANEDNFSRLPELNHMNLDRSYSQEFEHCQCPTGYTGLQCEYRFETCGNTNHPCFYGSTCEETTGECICSNANEMPTGAMLVSGTHCQHVSGAEFCPTTGNGGASMYCVNGGICDVDPEGHAICRCTSEYHGTHCEHETELVEPPRDEPSQQHQAEPEHHDQIIDVQHPNHDDIHFSPNNPGDTLANEPSHDRLPTARDPLYQPSHNGQQQQQQQQQQQGSYQFGYDHTQDVAPYNFGYDHSQDVRPQESTSTNVAALFFLALALICSGLIVFIGAYEIRRRNLERYGDKNLALYTADENNNMDSVSYRDHVDDDVPVEDLTEPGTASSSNTSVNPGDSSPTTKTDGNTTFVEKSNGVAAIVRNAILGNNIGDVSASGGGDKFNKFNDDILSSVLGGSRKDSGGLDGSDGSGVGGVGYRGYSDNPKKNISKDEEDQQQSSQRSLHSSIPLIDVGPERDYDGNELNDVEFT